jgi:hypothetical protein
LHWRFTELSVHCCYSRFIQYIILSTHMTKLSDLTTAKVRAINSCTHRPCPSPPGRRHVGGALATGRRNVDAATTPVSESTRRQLQAASEKDILSYNYST